ncbi:MAG: phage integrase SAM-like domain-containing protein [Saprospiraceae bacterium]|nr:phage integrase SAM-like domain-containing protein [Saprospiraceae bacterium]
MAIRFKRQRITRPHFNLKSRTNQNESLIFLYYKYSRDYPRLKYSIGIKVLPKYWDKKKGKVRETTELRSWESINKILADIESKAREVVKLIPSIDHSKFKSILDNHLSIRQEDRPKLYPALLDFIENYIEVERSKPYPKDTWKKYLTFLNLLKLFCKDNDIRNWHEDIDMKFRKDFESWCYKAPRSHSQNSLEKNINLLSYFMRRSYERSYTNEEGKRMRYHENTIPFEKNFAAHRVKTSRHPLNVEELTALLNFNGLPPHLEEVKDLFLMSAFGGGYRYSDYIKIKKENIFTEEGVELLRLFITKADTKSKDNEVVIPVFPQFKQLLLKYNYQVPKTKSSQKSNVQLKEICKMASLQREVAVQESKGGKMVHSVKQIWELVTNHTARFSFITNALNHYGMTAFDVSKITGQSLQVLLNYEHGDKTKNAIEIARKHFKN